MTDAAWASLATAATVVIVAAIQRNRDIKLREVADQTREVAAQTHEVAKIIKTDVNNNWKVASDRIDQLQSAMQEAGIKVPPIPAKP